MSLARLFEYDSPTRVLGRLVSLWQTAMPQQCKTVLCTSRPLDTRNPCPYLVQNVQLDRADMAQKCHPRGRWTAGIAWLTCCLQWLWHDPGSGNRSSHGRRCLPKSRRCRLRASRDLDLSDEVVRDVLTNLQRGLEDPQPRPGPRCLRCQQNMKDFPQFRDQMTRSFASTTASNSVISSCR